MLDAQARVRWPVRAPCRRHRATPAPIASLLADYRDAGRLRPVAGVVDRDDRECVFATLASVQNGSTTGCGVIQNAIQVDLVRDGRLPSLVVEGFFPEQVYLS